MSSSEDRYREAFSKRKAHVDRILASKSQRRVVVAGPGTGKTYLFKEVLKGKTNTLTLTFVNSLVDDLSLELYGLSDVRTLHGFARQLLSKISHSKSISIFPGLPQVIKQDATFLLGKDIDFESIFNSRDDSNANIRFYRGRRQYYGDAFGYSDVIFAAVKHLEAHPEKVPSYEQIVVDEFQDFNPLEVSLIELLAQKSPVLLAGDDDQALYQFKHASPEHIRHKQSGRSPDYEAFDLPFCSRCPRVIVEAANDIVREAKNNGLLGLRIDKPYVYFESKEKDSVSEIYPRITYAQRYASQIPWFIETKIREIASVVRGKFRVLIISPTRIQSRGIATALKSKGLMNVDSSDKPAVVPLLSGLKILMEDKTSNLGWRIISGGLLSREELGVLLEKTDGENAKPLHELVGSECKTKTRKMIRALKRVTGRSPLDGHTMETLNEIGIDPYDLVKGHLSDRFLADGRGGDPAIRRIPIKATTVESSKGLAEDYVFITHFDDRYFISQRNGRSAICDRDVCKFLVALTRAKSKVFLVSSQRQDPLFLQWIGHQRIERE